MGGRWVFTRREGSAGGALTGHGVDQMLDADVIVVKAVAMSSIRPHRLVRRRSGGRSRSATTGVHRVIPLPRV